MHAGTLHLPALSVVRTVFTQEQADYFGVKVESTLNDGPLSLLSWKVQLKCCRLQRFRIVKVSWIHCAGVPRHKKSELRAHQMARNCGLPGFTPHKIRAELSSNGSFRPASDKKSELSFHQMAHPASFGQKIRAESSSKWLLPGELRTICRCRRALELLDAGKNEGLSPRPPRSPSLR